MTLYELVYDELEYRNYTETVDESLIDIVKRQVLAEISQGNAVPNRNQTILLAKIIALQIILDKQLAWALNTSIEEKQISEQSGGGTIRLGDTTVEMKTGSTATDIGKYGTKEAYFMRLENDLSQLKRKLTIEMRGFQWH